MKVFDKKHLVFTLIALLVIFSFGAVLVKNQKKITGNKQESQTQTQENGDSREAVETSGLGQVEKSSNPATPTVNTSVAELKDVSLTAYLVRDAITSADGKTSINAGSITPYFYAPSGLYSVQKLSGKDWTDVATSINYPGHGGLAAGTVGSNEDSINYRMLKIENSKVTAISKTFTVNRSDLAGGVFTYN